jgi:hypothetical protein
MNQIGGGAMADIRTLTVTGPFTDDEFAEVVALMRNIDMRHPDAVFGIIMDDPAAGRTLDDAERAVVAALPVEPGRVTVVSSYGRKPHPPL